MTRNKIHKILYYSFLSGIGFSLPLSVWLISLFTILLAINWILSGNQKAKLQLARKNKPLLIFLTGYLVYLIWMINSSDLAAGLIALRLKLPLLLIPLIVSTSGYRFDKVKKYVFSSFLLGVLISTLSGVIIWKFSSVDIIDRREISVFISHIRLALMVCMAVFVSLWYAFDKEITNIRIRVVYGILSVWFMVYIFILMSLTGVVIFLVLTLFSISRFMMISRPSWLKYPVVILIVVICAACTFFISGEINQYRNIKDNRSIDSTILTKGGREYIHYPEREDRENGHYVWRYICEEELAPEWNRVSNIDYWAEDARGHQVRFTLIRYLSSLGYKKDSVAVSLLNKDDISIIEKGYANVIFKDGTGLKDKFYESLWQIDYYRRGGNPQGHSITQRIEYLKNCAGVIRANYLFGTGTGDFENEIRKQFDLDDSPLDQEFRRITHNQFLTTLATFGIFGFILFWAALIFPVILKRSYKNWLFIVFATISVLSFLGEDTLDMHTGVTFFSYFYTLLVLNDN